MFRKGNEKDMSDNRMIQPDYNPNKGELYSDELMIEYMQCIDEGLDVENLRPLFEAVADLDASPNREKLADVLFDYVINAPVSENYRYNEPSELEDIKKLRIPYASEKKILSDDELENRIHGAWLGRVCGCLLGKPLEGMRAHEMVPFLKEIGNYPMNRYVLSSDITEEICGHYEFYLKNKCWADTADGMPPDDDTNYTVLYQYIVDKFGRDFRSENIVDTWLRKQPKTAYFTAERVAYTNFVNGFAPPYSAVYKNKFREWIGAQIRGDYFGYINPGDGETAAEMAFRDARISHTKNGIYGEMFASAMIAAAAVSDNVQDAIKGGLAQIPHTSRLYEDVMYIIDSFNNGKTYDDCYSYIHKKYDEVSSHGWCHTIPNAMIVAAALLYGGGDFGKTLCLAVQSGFDTDCNGATAGSVVGMMTGADSIGNAWTKPVNNIINTSVLGIDRVLITDCVKKTMEHIKQ